MKPGAGASPSWYQCATAGLRRAASRPTTARVEASTTIIAGAARSTTRSTSGAGEPPVDRIGDDALARAGAVELEVGGVVLGEDADPIAASEAEGGQPGGQRVDAVPELAERDRPLALDDRGGAAVDVAPRAIMS